MVVKPTQALIKYFKAKIIFLTLENYQTLLWRILQTGKYLWETVALSLTMKYRIALQLGHQPERKIGSLYEFVRFVRVRTLIKTDLRTVKSF